MMIYYLMRTKKWGTLMAEIKDFKRNQYLLKGPKSKTALTDESDERDKKSFDSMVARHRQLKLYTVIGVLALAGVFLLGAYFHWKNIVYTDYEVIQQSDWVRAGEAKCLNLDGFLFTYSNDGMSCTNTRGSVVWNQTYEMQNPIVKICKKTVAVGDYNGRKIYVSDTQGNLGTIETTMPIRDFCVSLNGIVAAVLDDSTITAIYLYSTTGELLASFKTTMSESGYPIAVDISDNGSMVAVSYIKAENGSISSNIGFYNFSSVGRQYTDNFVSGYGYLGAVVPIVNFMSNDTAFAVADNRLMFYRGRQKPESLSEIIISEEIQSVFYDDSHVGLVFYNPVGDTTYRLDVYNTNAEKVSEIYFNIEYTDILFDTASIILRSDSECIIYDWGGKLKYEGAFKERITCLIPTGNIARYTLVTDDTIQQIQLY